MPSAAMDTRMRGHDSQGDDTQGYDTQGYDTQGDDWPGDDWPGHDRLGHAAHLSPPTRSGVHAFDSHE
ncbi:hypothetical protein B9Z37_11455 [Limnohabitans parvus II-B4]|uniref:Uncharacterized protein n=1 Tax=Limnohabitans parvus II-B4 TaxID=1293052 RepID=A0A315E4H5_9BURK|nr:hypothetical protein B9Z37_11455 [Limnohabitans parvus II-B4]